MNLRIREEEKLNYQEAQKCDRKGQFIFKNLMDVSTVYVKKTLKSLNVN